VFEGEGLTPKNVRHCVNSISMVFHPREKVAVEQAFFAGGCFWGVEHYFRQVPGVLSVTSGYTGGHVANPTYEQVCTGETGHAESVRVIFDSSKVSYEKLARLFFEIHDPTTVNRQGPDEGLEYRSAVFYANDRQKQTVEKLIALLRARGYKVVTQVAPATAFYGAEEYHQDYMGKHPGRYDCHVPVPRFKQDSKALTR
jgi:peptide methionine sulfoxide reductase msrA/msrB